MKAPVVGAVVAVAAVSHPPAGRDPARVQVTGREFSLTLSRTTVPTGPIVIELANLGEDDHDLALRRLARGATTRRIRTVASGGLGQLETSLRPGRYALWCTLPYHRARGMRATLIVTQRQ